jgi:hypothetical protein
LRQHLKVDNAQTLVTIASPVKVKIHGAHGELMPFRNRGRRCEDLVFLEFPRANVGPRGQEFH